MSVAGFGGADSGGTGLASHAAQMGFARGAQMQQQQLHHVDGRLALESKAGAVKSRIRDVWKHNLAHEMAVLRSLVDKYPYISMVRARKYPRLYHGTGTPSIVSLCSNLLYLGH